MADGTRERFQDELNRKRSILLRELRDRSFWFVQLRWWVPPSIVLATAAAHLLGVGFPVLEVLLVAAFILLYNIVFYAVSLHYRETPIREGGPFRPFAFWQVVLDYAAMFLLIHFTGGAASPLIFFFIFHIIFTSILLPPLSAYGFATLVVAGMSLIAAAEFLGFLENHTLVFRDSAINLAREPYHMFVELSFFAASVFIAAFSTTSIMTMLRKRILELGQLSESVNQLNNKLQALFSMIEAIGSAQHLDQVLNKVTSALQAVMNVKGISVKLLSEDGKHLRYAAAVGLPEEFLEGKLVEVEKSPLNRRIIEGEPFVTGRVTMKEFFQFGEALAAVHVRSVLFVPLPVEGRAIGILGAYCVHPDRFSDRDVDFLRLAGELVAIALENARAYEAVEKLLQERGWYLMRVTHNLRAPLSAMISILETVRGGYFGELNENQSEYLRRMDRRARSMLAMINELMTLAENRGAQVRSLDAAVDLAVLAGRAQRTFQDEAAEKGLEFKVEAPPDLPVIRGDPALLEQMLENLVSNAIKYTARGGRVGLKFIRSARTVRIEISDTGIGIPKTDMPNLFKEFFRSENARNVEAHGTGLGLAIVKEIVERHGGRVLAESEEGFGTIFVVHLPIARQGAGESAIGNAGNGTGEGGNGEQKD